MAKSLIYQCTLSDGEWTTIGWVEEAKAKVGTAMNVVQRWYDGNAKKVSIKIRPFNVAIVYQPPQTDETDK